MPKEISNQKDFPIRKRMVGFDIVPANNVFRLEISNQEEVGMEGGWSTVSRKKRSLEPKTIPLDREEIMQVLKTELADWNFSSVVLYGSVTETAKVYSLTSDVDVMVFVKTFLDLDELKNKKMELTALIGRKIDLVVMQITSKSQEPIFHDSIFYEQVWETGQTILGDNFKDYLERAKKLKKI